jgi:hydrogenase maturation protein HypF
MGRFFDGVAVLLGLSPEVTFEAQLPLALEQLAASGESTKVQEGDGELLDWRPWVREMIADRATGVPIPTIARGFHDTLVRALLRAVGDASEVVLCGGCFQNRLLLEGALAGLGGRRVWVGESVPMGDGAIALGQAWVARRRGGG